MEFTQGHALIVGVGRYQHVPRWDVPITAEDAEAVASVLRDSALCGYPASQITLLRREDAGRERVLAELGRLAARIGENDTVFVFYSGHGEYSEDGAYHLSTYDTKLTSKHKIQPETAISHQELILRLREIKARRVLLVFNACHAGNISALSGSGTSEETLGQAMPASTSNALLATGAGRIIINACREDQVSYIGDGKLTRFTAALVEGLRGRGDVTSRSGYISAYDLYLHTYFSVHDQVERLGKQQDPELTVLKAIGPFAVSLYRGTATLRSFDESDSVPTEGAVREVRPERSIAALNIIMSQIAGRDAVGGNQVRAGRDAAGRDLYKISGDYVGRDKITGDKVMGDKITGDKISVGSISGNSNVSIGRGQQAVGGDTHNLSGVSNSILNIKSTLSDVTQTIGAASNVSPETRSQLQRLTQELADQLRQLPQQHGRDSEVVTKRLQTLVEAGTAPLRDHEVVEFSSNRLLRAAEGIVQASPQIGITIRRIIDLVSNIAP